MGDEFTHLTESGVHMVEVGEKPDQKSPGRHGDGMLRRPTCPAGFF